MSTRKLICFVIVDGFQTLDLFGPMEAFAAASELSGGAYDWTIASLMEPMVKSESGAKIVADTSLGSLSQADTIFLVGGAGPRRKQLDPGELALLIGHTDRAGRIASVCTGASLLAQLPISNGKCLSTHWRHAQELKDAHPSVHVDADSLFIRDGKVWSSAGVTAGIDLAIAMIADDLGHSIASSVARQLVVYARRAGNQSQFSEPLNAQSQYGGRLGDLAAWIADHLSESLTVEVLAEQSCMSLRHFTRVFSERFGVTPAQYVARLRLDRARVLLSQGDGRVSQIASMVGFQSTDSFRRAFERKFGVSPVKYREQFPES